MECLKNGIVRINKPVSNKWFNENFDIEMIEAIEGKEKEFYEAFKDYTIGIMKKEDVVYEGKITEQINLTLDPLKSEDYKYQIVLYTSKNGMIYHEETAEIKKGEENKLINFKFVRINVNTLTDKATNVQVDEDGNKAKLNISEHSENIGVEIEPHSEEYSYTVKVFSKGSGRLVPTNLGLTVVAPDGELVATTVQMAKEYGINVHKIDPYMDEINKGNVAKFNPLKGSSPEKIGDIVSSILVSMDSGSNKTNPYFTNASVRAVRNLVILLKISYPELYQREPTLVDVLSCLNNFNNVTEPVEYVLSKPALLNKWQTVIDYFNTSFIDAPKDHSNDKTYSETGSQKKETQRAVGGIINQLDNLLGREEIRYILCSEDDSIDLAKALRKGECIAISTRQGNLGDRLGRAFALFFILSLQNEVLSRYAENENPEIPHFLIIDEFPMYCNEATEIFFSFARKYKCSVTVAIQNMGQLKKISDEFGETIFTNTTTKLLLPKANLEDRKYWSDFFGSTQEMEIMTGISTSSIFSENPSYTESMRGTLAETKNISEEQVDDLNFQQLYYTYVNKKGRKVIGKGTTEFLKTNKESYMEEILDFEKFSISEEDYLDKQNKENQIKEEKKMKEVEEKLNNTTEDLMFKSTENTIVIDDINKSEIALETPADMDNELVMEIPLVKEGKSYSLDFEVIDSSNGLLTDQKKEKTIADVLDERINDANENEKKDNIRHLEKIEFIMSEEIERSF